MVLSESSAAERWSERERSAAALAVRACQAAGWVGVAAVQLVVDGGQPRLAGLETAAGTAPAVEAVSGVDLVRLSLSIAAGEAVGAAAGPGAPHAVAARIMPREPEDDTGVGGRVERLRLPSDPMLRIEAEVDEGDLCAAGEPVATLVAVGDSRAEALARLGQALEDSDVLVGGRGTSKAWLAALCTHPDLRSGTAGDGRIALLAARGEELVSARPEAALLAAALEVYDLELALERARFLAEARRGRPRVGPSSGRVAELRYEGHRYRIEVRQIGPATYRVVPAGGTALDVKVERLADRERRLVIGEERIRVLSSVDGLRHLVEIAGVPHVIQREPAGLVVAPMPSVVMSVPVHVGQRVAAGEPVARIESMKVEVVVTAPSAGVVREIVAVPNSQVDAGTPLLRLEPDDAEPAEETGLPLDLKAAPAPLPATPRERYLAALDELHRVLLGFDVAPAEARRLAAGWAQLSASVVSDDPQVLAAEEAAFSALVDVQSLFSRTARREGGAEGKPPLEELWRYLHEPEHRGSGLSPDFVEGLRRALSHYGVSLESPGPELENALLRIQKAHERAGEPMVPVIGDPGAAARLADARPGRARPGDAPAPRPAHRLGRELHRPAGRPGQRASLPALRPAALRDRPAPPPTSRPRRTWQRWPRPGTPSARRSSPAWWPARSRWPRSSSSGWPAPPRSSARAWWRRCSAATTASRPVGPVTARVEDGVSCAVAEYASEGRRVRLVRVLRAGRGGGRRGAGAGADCGRGPVRGRGGGGAVPVVARSPPARRTSGRSGCARRWRARASPGRSGGQPWRWRCPAAGWAGSRARSTSPSVAARATTPRTALPRRAPDAVPAHAARAAVQLRPRAAALGRGRVTSSTAPPATTPRTSGSSPWPRCAT